jgi:lysophospholipase L1-like esterase
MHLRHLAASLGLALLATGCRSDEALNAPNLSNNSGLLERYVSMGNSITAGFQSAGINDSTQLQSYAVIFAQQAGAPFFVPLLNKPGCPAPFDINSTNPPHRLGGAGDADCALREGAPLPYVSNVAVPGVTSFGIGSNDNKAGGTNALTQFILGGRTQIKAMTDAQPTFVSVWIGNNDIIGSLTNSTNPGNPAFVTPEAAFEANYGPILDDIASVGAKAVLISVVDVASIPFATPGAVYWCLRTGFCPGVPAAAFPPNFSVALNCAPRAAVPSSNGDSVLVPVTVGVAKIAAAQTVPAATFTLDCSVDNEVVLPSEFANLRLAVAGFNAYISNQAQQRGWAYFDVNPTLLAAKAEPITPGQFPKIASFPCIPGGPCGGTMTPTSPVPNILFGTYFSLDGVHPGAPAHRVIADSVISAVNHTYGTTIPFAGP